MHIHNETNLHSTVVLLKVERLRVCKLAILYLHSTVVLLKENIKTKRHKRVYKFTFYCSSIKGPILQNKNKTSN